jgi:hypothetical protein
MQTANCTGRYSLLLFSLLFTVFTNCYTQTAITGLVLNPSGQPVANATILLLQSRDSTLVKGLVTASDGKYSFTGMTAGSYIVSSSFTGYKSLYSLQFAVNDQKEVRIGTLQFTESEKELSEVKVSAKKPLFEQKIDRMVVNVAASITAAGSTALEVLQRSPGIIVDQQNNSLSMSGKSGVVIMINGKISRMPLTSVIQMLSGMPASNIERIELITTPPANYDAEGNAGYINIVLKTSTQYGTNGSYSITGGYGGGLLSSGNINFNHRREKVNIYGDLSLLRRDFTQSLVFRRWINNPGKIVATDISTERDPTITNIDARLGIDYEINTKTVIGALITGYNNRWSMTARNNSNIYLNGVLDTMIYLQIDEIHPLLNYAANVNLQHNFSSTERISINADYVYYLDKDPVAYINTFFDGDGNFLYNQGIRSNKLTPIRFWTSNVDYSRKLGKKATMEAGVKGTMSHFVNEVEVERQQQQNNWIKDDGLTAKYNLNERIAAAYVSFTIGIDQQTNAKLGMRYEYTISNLDAENAKNLVDRQYGNFFPTVFISRKLNEKNSVNLSYSRRITRPTFNDLAPFVIFTDPNTFISGNPALQPAISNTVKADYILNKFIVSLSFTRDDHAITRFFPKLDTATNKQTISAQNQPNLKTVSLNLSLPFKLNKWWSIQNNLAGLGQEMNAVYLDKAIRVRQKIFNISSVHTFTLPKDYTIELTCYYQSAGLSGIMRAKSFIIMDLGVQKKLGPTQGVLRINISNITGPLVFRTRGEIPEQHLQFQNRLRFQNTVARITYTKNFGNQKIKEKRNRTTSSEQERQRVNTSN